MFIYLLLIILLLVQRHFIHNNSTYLKVAFWEMLFVSGFRMPILGVGSDTEFYCENYVELSRYSISEIINNGGHEIGFSLFCNILSRINTNPQFLIFVSQAIMLYIVLTMIRRKSNMPWLSVVLYITLMFYFGAMNVMRFCLACSILLCSIDYIIERKLLKFGLIVFVASQFHFSSFLFILIYFIYPIRLTKKNVIAISIPFIALMYAFTTAFQLLISINSRYTSYDSGIGEFYQSAFANILIFIINALIFLFISYKSPVQILQLEKENKLYFLCIYLSVIFAAMSINVMIIVRFVTMFSVFGIIYIPNVIKSLKKYSVRNYYIFLFVFISILQVIIQLTYRPEWYLVTPYKNFLF